MTPHNCVFRLARDARRLVPAALLLSAAVLGACEDPFKVKATNENASQPFVLHALSGSQLPFVTALFFPVKQVARVDGSFSFDVAFDLNAAGDIVLLPVGIVGQNPAGNRRVGILKATAVYDSVKEAPTSGYTVDTATVIKRGQTAIVQAQEALCSTSLTPYLYAKIVVDSVDLVQRTIVGRTTINTNCGFRSLAAGLPGF
jgi:hypothetical protein